MEQIETQATDLRYLTEEPAAPAPGSSSMSTTWPANSVTSPRQQSGDFGRLSALGSSAPVGDNSAFPSTQTSPFAGSDDRSTPKRKSEVDLAAKQQRSKRNRYISIACNECKRRKIKCNGEIPCQRCGNLSLACLYSANCCSNNFRDSDEYRQLTNTVRRLEEQVGSLNQNVDSLRQETQRLAPLHDRLLPMPTSSVASPSPSTSMPALGKTDLAPIRPLPIFRGPTSVAFTVDVAKNTLHNMGYGGEPAEEGSAAASPALPPPLQRPAHRHGQDQGQGQGPYGSSHPQLPHPPLRQATPPPPPPPADPLWEFDRNEMVRLCRVHEDEVGIMYPVVKIETVIKHANSLIAWMEAARRNSASNSLPDQYAETMESVPTLLLKIVICSALAVENHGHSERAIRLYASMQPIIDRKLMTDPSDIANLPLLALAAGYRFLSNDEVLAWRVMGQVARHCLEQGLHRREGLAKIVDEEDRINAINTFWSAYVLDRRWSFGTGLPYVVHDDKVDPELPLPERYPYLVAMITYSRLGAKIWRLVDFFEPAVVRRMSHDDVDALDREILQWYDTVPEGVKITNFGHDLPLPSTPSYNLQRLQIWTRLRLNQIRIWLHTPILHSASSIMDNMPLAQRAVDLAKDTIRYLDRLNNSSNLYRRIQVFYHQFLTSAIVVLFLASTHQPVQFSAQCRDEFYMALNLIKDMSAKSWVSQRLWLTLRSLKVYAPRLGLEQVDQDSPLPPPSRIASTATKSHADNASNTGSTANVAASYKYHNIYMGPPDTSPSSTSSPYDRQSSHSSQAPHDAVRSGPWSAPSQQQQQQQSQTSTPAYRAQLPPSSSTDSPAPTPATTNGMQLQNEMCRLFEGYVGMSGIPHLPAGTVDSSGMPYGAGNVAGETLYEQLKQLF